MTEKILTNKKARHGYAYILPAAYGRSHRYGRHRSHAQYNCPHSSRHRYSFALSGFPMMGLKILKPQEALVLTLFGHYYGTLKGEGYYYVNPFCTGVNPAAKTRLSQSGDVKTLGVKATTGDNTTSIEVDTTGKKLAQDHDPQQ